MVGLGDVANGNEPAVEIVDLGDGLAVVLVDELVDGFLFIFDL